MSRADFTSRVPHTNFAVRLTRVNDQAQLVGSYVQDPSDRCTYTLDWSSFEWARGERISTMSWTISPPNASLQIVSTSLIGYLANIEVESGTLFGKYRLNCFMVGTLGSRRVKSLALEILSQTG